MIDEAWLFLYRFHDVIDPFPKGVVHQLFRFCAALDFQMIETFIRIVVMNDFCPSSLVESHNGSHVDRQRIGQRFLLELRESKQTVIAEEEDPTEGNSRRSVVAGSTVRSILYDDFGRK